MKSGHTRPSTSYCDRNNIDHWYQSVKQIKVHTFPHYSDAIVLAGGSDNGKFVYVLEVRGAITYVNDIAFESGDIVLQIQEHKVSGFTLLDAVRLLEYYLTNSDLLSIECIPCGKYYQFHFR